VSFSAAAEAFELAAAPLVVRGQEPAPAPVAQLGRALGGADDVRERHGRRDPVDVGRVPPARRDVLDLVQDVVLGPGPGQPAARSERSPRSETQAVAIAS
jgi:hypothetical protein